ncbi:sugar ABC transporter permease [Bacillus sp. HMF5848]|uniref:carbohydrate ABC transporter permease n=1 Tax=Bacillus sp. HMF5848 TaxID=2495421 RepID=UPI000F77570C|nr:sugar ABC transporter permease [Bacillus sp. HMF5848]RSK25808.1 sugar ABC transporter permease [Bacillus sp. HMF5848]
MRLISRKTLALFFLPGAIFMVMFLIYPIIKMAFDSFYEFDIYTNTKSFVGFENYVAAFTQPDFLEPLKNTLIYVIAAVTFETIIGLLIALVVEIEFKGSKIIRSLLLSPLMIAPLIAGLTWRLMFNSNFGIINEILKNIGILDRSDTITWLADKNLALAATIVADIWLTVPFMMLMCLAGLQSIDKSMIEAAKIDGANFFQILFSIKIPAMKAILLTAIAVRTIDAARTFDIVYVMAEEQVDLLSTVIYKTLVKYHHTGYASAMALIFIAILVVFTLVFLQNLWRPSKKV